MEPTAEPLLSEDIPPPHITPAYGMLMIPPGRMIARGTVLIRNLELDPQLDALQDMTQDAGSPDVLALTTELHFSLPPEADPGPLPSRSGIAEVSQVRLVPDPDDASAQVFTFRVSRIRFAEELHKPVETPAVLAE